MLLGRAAYLSLPRRFRRILCGWFGLALVAAEPAFAEDPPRRVGSLDYVSGEVLYALHGDLANPVQSNWLQTDFNQPISEDMSVQTGALARARIKIGPNVVEVSAETLIDVLNLSDQLVEASLRQGRVFLQIRDLQDGERVEIEIPTGALWLLKPGTYDIDAGADDRPARVAVFEGTARFADGKSDLRIEAGQEAQVTASYPATVAIAQLPPGVAPTGLEDQSSPSDEFLAWAMESEFNPEQPQAVLVVSRQVTGCDRLSAYGRWEKHKDYGAVWIPSELPADWAPYRFGHWASIKPWGWTWIDDQPWGFAPFHFGRWVNIDERWAWVPGSRVEHPVYAPALVAFIEDPGAGQGGDAPVGWFPLAPGESFVPWYQAGPEYIESVNVVYAARDRYAGGPDRDSRAAELRQAEFANRRFATLVHRDAMANGRPVIQEMVHVPADRLERAMILRGAPRVMPAAARIVAAPSGLRDDMPHPTPAIAGPGGLRPAAPEHPHPSAAVARPEAHPFARSPEPAGHMPQPLRPPERDHPTTARPQYGRSEPQFRPEMPHGPASAQQFGRPEGAHMPAPAPQQMARQFGRPEVFHTPAPTYRAGTSQFGRPQVSAMPRPGAPLVMRPGAPAVVGRGAPQLAARPAVSARAAPAPAALQKKK